MGRAMHKAASKRTEALVARERMLDSLKRLLYVDVENTLERLDSDCDEEEGKRQA